MMSYGAQLRDLKRKVTDYIFEQVKSGAYNNSPGDMKIYGEKCSVVEALGGLTPLNTFSVDRLCAMADKIHFRPLSEMSRVTIVKPSPTPVSKIQNVPPKPSIPRRKRVLIDFLTLPLRKMQLDECIIIYPNCEPEAIGSRKCVAKKNLAKAVREMGLEGSYVVGVADGNNVGVWRIR